MEKIRKYDIINEGVGEIWGLGRGVALEVVWIILLPFFINTLFKG